MAFDRHEILAANSEFVLELRHTGQPRPVVPPDHGPVVPRLNANGTGRDEAEPERGLRCRACNCAHFIVLETRQAYGGKIMRRRMCRSCSTKLVTYEKLSGS
jgi:hypothetical protein